MNARVKAEIAVTAPPQTVFDYLSDLDCHRKWNPHLKAIEPTGKLMAGVSYKTVSSVMGREVVSRNHVTECQVPSLLTIKNEEGLIQYTVSYSLEPTKNGTHLSCTCDLSASSSVFHLAKPVMMAVAKDKLASDLSALKLLVESATASA
jgi:carbon monoxide dehydrogenase subunit G